MHHITFENFLKYDVYYFYFCMDSPSPHCVYTVGFNFHPALHGSFFINKCILYLIVINTVSRFSTILDSILSESKLMQ